jgi:hypothetical protein
VSIYDLVDKIDETGCCDRLFGEVVVTGYLYRFGAWLMHLFMVQVDASLMHGSGYFYMIQVEINGNPPFLTCSKQFSHNFGNLLFLAVFYF